MIHNFTRAEWQALTEAVVMYETDLEQNGGPGDRATQKRQTLNRAFTKAHQLAPETTS